MPRSTTAVLAALATLLLAGPAAAQPGKANKHDRDRDGLTDRQEQLLGTDPAKADSDGDGTKDGKEGGGKVVARKGDRLVVRLFGGRTVRAKLTSATDVSCPEPDEAEEEDAEDVPAEEEVPLEAEDLPEPLPVDLPADLQSVEDEEPADDEEDEEEEELGCDASDLVPGAVIAESDLAGRGKARRWTRLVLAS